MVAVMFAWQKVVDARGRRWTPCTIRHAQKSSGYAREFLLQRGETASLWWVFLICGSFFAVGMTVVYPVAMYLFMGAPLRIGIRGSGSGTIFVFFFYFIGFGGIMGLFYSLYIWRSPKHARRAMLRSGLCPACAYKLDGVEPDADACTVCPECGAAWRVYKADADQIGEA